MNFQKKKIFLVAYMSGKMSKTAIHYWPVHHISSHARFSALWPFPEVMFGGHDISGLPRLLLDHLNLDHKR